MRCSALIVLAAILMAVLAPQSLELMARDGHLMIGSLDVCHATAPAVAPQGDMSCIDTSRPVQLSDQLVAFENIPEPGFTFLLLSARPEQPPRIS